MRILSALLALAFVSVLPKSLAASPECEKAVHLEVDYVVCRVSGADGDIRMFLNNAAGAPFGHFRHVDDALRENGERLAFAMNAGMYAPDRAPAGLYVEAGATLKAANTNEGPGNFHLKPNGVFWVAEDDDGVRRAHVTTTEKYLAADEKKVRYATQSGPMLVIDGVMHPRFLEDATSKKRRNGVGVTDAGEVIFVLADAPVTFHDFAAFFRDDLKTPDALFLDGSISRVYAPSLARHDRGAALGPIVGVVVSNE
ncbi:MAG: phosphodiester glycosidase family protein [Pseudomonadota bacterium]